MSEKDTHRLFSWEQVAAALFHFQGIEEGLYHIGVNLRMAGLTTHWEQVGNPPGEAIPTAMVGITAIGLTPAKAPGPMVFDAAKLTQRNSATFETKRLVRAPMVLSKGAKPALPTVVVRAGHGGKKVAARSGTSKQAYPLDRRKASSPTSGKQMSSKKRGAGKKS